MSLPADNKQTGAQGIINGSDVQDYLLLGVPKEIAKTFVKMNKKIAWILLGGLAHNLYLKKFLANPSTNFDEIYKELKKINSIQADTFLHAAKKEDFIGESSLWILIVAKDVEEEIRRVIGIH